MSLKVIHTSDWHLGKKIYKTSRLEEQKLFLDWLLETIKNEEIDALIVAGDIFDTPRPSDQALEVYFQFLKNFMTQTKAHLYLISGNHDSGRFLEAPKGLFDVQRIHLSGVFDLNQPIESYQHRLSDGGNTEMLVTLMPYFRSFDLSKSPGSQEDGEVQIIHSLKGFFQNAKNNWKKDSENHLLVAHHLFGQFQPAGSEQGLNLSGLETIPLSLLDEHFDYVALGHIHNPQWVKHQNPKTRYCGSPIAFRFSETKEKSLTYLHLDHKTIDAKALAIPCFRPLIQLKTTDKTYIEEMQKLLTELPQSALPALIEVVCELSSAQAGLSDTLREMCLDFPCELVSVQTFLPKSEASTFDTYERTQTTTEKLFEMFYKQKFPEQTEVPSEIKRIFLELLEELRVEDHKKMQDDSLSDNGEHHAD